MGKVIEELKSAPDGSALRIPLAELKGVSAPEFRSAVARGAASKSMNISTYSDSEYFYVWVRSAKTKGHERKRSRKGSRGSK